MLRSFVYSFWTSPCLIRLVCRLLTSVVPFLRPEFKYFLYTHHWITLGHGSAEMWQMSGENTFLWSEGLTTVHFESTTLISCQTKAQHFFLFSLVRNKEVKTLSTLSGCMENINGVVDTFTRSEYLPPTNPSKPYLPSVSPTESFKCSLLSPSWGWLRSRSGLRLHFHSTASFF